MFRRTTAVILTGSILAFSQLGCIGRGALGAKVMEFNLEVVEDKWSRWGVFLILNVIPVYPLAAMVDLLIINSVEFHSGTNPINGKPRLAVREGHEEVITADGSRALSTMNDDGSVTIEMQDAQGRGQTLRLVPVPGGIEAHDEDGEVLGRVDGDGKLQSKYGPVQVVPSS